MSLIHEKISAIIGEVKAVGKDHTNDAQKYKFRAIDDVFNALNPVLSKHKVCIIPKYEIIHNEVVSEIKKNQYGEKQQNTRTVILKGNYKIVAEDGTCEEVNTFGEAIDFGDKAFNKAMSQALKYCLFQVFCIPTEENKDTEFENPEIPNKKENKNQVKEEHEVFTDEEKEKIDTEFPFKIPEKIISDAQVKRLKTIAGKKDQTKAKEILSKHGYVSSKEIKVKDYDEIIKEIEAL